ncbi:MAG: DinB family protein [Gemmatimonadota bacterium]|nr:MAG: DinB family protein [Gemmatimonadota bacterium]
MVDDPRLREILKLLDPPAGRRLWYGGATVAGCLRGITPEQAAWKPAAKRNSVWELTLHLAYWKYAVRRNLEALPQGTFARSPANWPAVPEPADAPQWKADRALLRSEHMLLVNAVRAFEPQRLDETAPGSGAYRFVDLLFGIVSHDLYHVGQIQVLKRMYETRSGRAQRGR